MPPEKVNYPLLMRFGFVGGSTAALCLGLTFGLVEGADVNPTWASTFALFVAVCYNYILHYHWTFSTDAPHGKVLVKYMTMCAGGLALNATVMELGVSIGDLHYMAVQIMAAILVVVWSICISSIWVFR
ncbi:MAG: GtrA family protein [Halioglobus sp.]